MAVVNFFTYTIVPFYVARSGATLLNLSNVTTIIWSMLFDIVLFGKPFYPVCLLGFCIELCAIIVFSLKSPSKKSAQGGRRGSLSCNETEENIVEEVNEKSPLFEHRRSSQDGDEI